MTTRTTKARARRRATPQAETADKYELYQRAVQEPDADIDFMNRIFRRHFGRPPRDLREDFCGAAYLSCRWVHRNPDNRAWGVDLDPEPLHWGLAHNVSALPDAARQRLTLIRGDVRHPREPLVDIVAAQNFSYFVFKKRDELRQYFGVARAGLREQGLFVLDLFGGPDAQRAGPERTRHKGFTYVWDQARYDAVQNEIVCHIHFDFPDGSRLTNAFSYDWRLWTIREIREVLAEAGFSRSEAYWEDRDDVYRRRESAENEQAWLAYVVGIR